MATVMVNERRLTIAEVATECGVMPRTVRNWANQGVRGVRLAAVYVGGQRFVSRESLAVFLGELNRGAADTPAQRAANETLRETENQRCDRNLQRLLNLNPFGR